VNQYDGSDREAGQPGGQRWCRVPDRRLRAAGGGGSWRGCWPQGGKVGGKLPELTQVRAVSARPVRSSSSAAVSLPAWKCSLRSDTTASRSASEALVAAGR